MLWSETGSGIFSRCSGEKDDASAKENALIKDGIPDLFTLLRVKKMTHPRKGMPWSAKGSRIFSLCSEEKDDAPAKGNAVVRDGVPDLFTLLRGKR